MKSTQEIIILDTTLREGEMVSGIQICRQDKIKLAQLLEQIGVNVIEVSYPAQSQKDFDDLVGVSNIIEHSIVCGLSSIHPQEIELVIQALKSANKPRVHLYSNVNFRGKKNNEQEMNLQAIATGIKLAKNFCEDIQWSAFDATRSESDFLCRAIEIAIQSGATTVSIPDSLGVCSSQDFSQLIRRVFNQVSNIEKATVAIHCHDDLDQAVENSLISLNHGVKQIEVSINGLGARKGNANLAMIAQKITQQKNYSITLDLTLLPQASALLNQILDRS